MRKCTISRSGAFFLSAMAVAGCSRPRSAVVAGAIPEGVPAFLRAHPLAPGQATRVDEVGRTPAASWHLAQVGTAETPHRHREHDLAVFMLRGEGVLTLEGRQIALRAGDATLVARDRTHWFARRGPEAAVTLVVFTPPLDAPDFVPADGVDSRPDGR